MKRYYLLLGISPGATQRQIEDAYLEQMRGLESGGVERSALQKVQEAYSALTEPRSRGTPGRPSPIQDITPTDLPQKPTLVEPSTSEEKTEPDVEVSLTQSFQTFHPSFEEIYERLWSNFTQKPAPKSEVPKSLTIDIPITPRQAFHCGKARVLVPTRILCPVCRGEGGVGPFACIRCDGKGALQGEYPLVVSFPAGVGDYTAEVSLLPLGIENLYLRARFRVTGEDV
jgi:DnaJ-class molecular chaperone